MNNVKLLPSLLIFAEVAKRKSFTKAANHLGMSKSAISQHISRLEDQMGTQLLSRNTRGMSLTSNGIKLLLRSENLKDQVDLAFQEIAGAEDTPSGIFSITSPHMLEKDVLTPALKQLCIEFPQIEPRILITDDALDLISENLDVAIFAGDLPDSNYRALPIGMMTEQYFASPEYIKKIGAPKKLIELSKHRWLLAKWQKNNQTFYENINQSEETVVLQAYARSNSLSSIVEMAKQGMGIALLSSISVGSYAQDGQLIHVLKNFHGKKWSFYFVHPFRGDKPIHITRFYQLIKYFYSKANINNTYSK